MRTKKFGFPPERKILKKSDFQRNRNNSKKIVARHWILFYSPNELSRGRLAVTASAKYGNAVKRNKFKRRLRELFRVHQADFVGFDLHFIAKNQNHELANSKFTFTEMEEDFQRVLHRLPKMVSVDPITLDV